MESSLEGPAPCGGRFRVSPLPVLTCAIEAVPVSPSLAGVQQPPAAPKFSPEVPADCDVVSDGLCDTLMETGGKGLASRTGTAGRNLCSEAPEWVARLRW